MNNLAFYLIIRLMKKLLLFIVLCLLLSGCNRPDDTIENRNVSPEEIPSDIVLYASVILAERTGFYYLGTGVAINNISDEGKVLDYTSYIYPLYDDDRLAALIIHTEGLEELISRDMIRTTLSADERYLLVRNNGMLVKISEEGESVIAGEPNIDIDERVIIKVRKRIKKTNDLGKERLLIKSENTVTDPQSGKKYSSSRIVVKFTDGESDSKVTEFEEFCKGKLRSSIKSAGIYVFEIEPSSFKRLTMLVEEAMKLDYVSSAALDEQKDMDPSGSTILPDR